MGIGSYLLNRESLELVKTESWHHGRNAIIKMGMDYYAKQADEVQEIVDSLTFMDLPNSGRELDEVLRQLVIHYYEKLFVLVKGYEGYWLAKNNIDVGDSLKILEEAQKSGKAVFMGQSHFGGTYFLALTLMIRGYNVSNVGKFPEPVGGMLKASIESITQRFNTGRSNLINLAAGDVNIPFTMMTALKSGQILSNVFDENNEFSRPVTLRGKTIYGGSGMDKILAGFNDDNLIVVTPFLIRTSEDTFRYELDQHRLADGDIIQSFYRSLEKRLPEYYAQWYFIHELAESMEKIEAKQPDRVKQRLNT